MTSKPTGRRVGRPPEPVPAIADKILELVHGGMPLTHVCELPGMPGTRTVSDWRAKDPEFAAAYERAREALGDIEADDARRIADAATPETYQVARLQVDVRMRRAACLCRKRWGQNTQVEHTGQVTIEKILGMANKLEAEKP